jgi:putative MATE family efflux protein
MTVFGFNSNFLKQVFKLAWPISLQNILVTVLGMVDIIMVSHLGESAVAAVGISNRVFFVVLIILMGVASGVSVLSAQYAGAAQVHKIKNTVAMGILFSILVLCPIVLLNFYYADNILQLASTDNSLVTVGEEYLWITVPSLFFLAIVMVLEHALRATGQVKLPMLFSVVAIILNIILNFWLINGGLGVDAMGVAGAAWATTIARLFHLLMIVYCLKKIIHPILPTRNNFCEIYDRVMWSKFVKLILPMMIGFGIWSLGTFVYQLIYGRMGTQELAIMSILTPIEGFLIAFFIGFSSACAIMIGQNLGKNNFVQAWKTGIVFSIGAPIVTLFLAFLLYILEDTIFLSFQSMTEQTLTLTSEIFLLLIFGTCLKVFNMTMSIGILRAGGDNNYCVLIDSIGMWVVSIPLTFMAAFYFQLPLFWVVVTAYSEEICKSFLFVWRMKKKVWLKNLTTD